MHAAGTDTCWLGVVTEGRRARYYFFCSLGHGLLLYFAGFGVFLGWVASWFMLVRFVESYTLILRHTCVPSRYLTLVFVGYYITHVKSDLGFSSCVM